VALPELAGQGIYELLDGVRINGQPYVGRSSRLLVDRGGPAPVEAFFDFVYQPLAEGGVVTGIAVACFEVTELARARRDAETANRAKDEFLAMLGHELRNPLAPILTALQLMQLRGVSGAERERGIIERQVKRVVGLVDDLLDVSRIARGKVHLHVESLDLGDVVDEAIEMTGPAIEERRHSLTVDVEAGLRVTGDRARLAQVITNLLTNAAKYTDANGTIRVSGRREEGSVVVSVSDNGRGIRADTLPRIFELFVQERQSVERADGGLGIGLAIVRSLVQAHGGSVTASSPGPDCGSTFTVTLPASVNSAAAPAMKTGGPDATRAASRDRILVVDDNGDAAHLLAESLAALGHATAVALDGPAALEIAQWFRPTFALLDLGLPVMDGFELGQRLREDPLLGEIVLLAITGYGQQHDRDRTRAAGFEAHLVKPVDVQQIDALIRNRASSSRAS
jgi:signal transduction histidine kinase/ActR/RegA family two-component response regulator